MYVKIWIFYFEFKEFTIFKRILFKFLLNWLKKRRESKLKEKFASIKRQIAHTRWQHFNRQLTQPALPVRRSELEIK